MVWSLLADKLANENVILNKSVLVISKFEKANFGSYECSTSFDSVLTRLELSLEKSLPGKISARTKSYVIESVNSNHNDLPQLRLDFVTPIENIKENGKVEIRCSSSTRNWI